MPVLEARGLVRTYRRGTPEEVRALENVEVRILPGCLNLITGASGSGKSTLLALLGAQERPDAGEVLFQGSSLAGVSDYTLARVRSRIGFVFQSFGLIPRLTAWENVAYPLIPMGVPRRQRFQRATELLSEVGLAGKEGRRPEELSGGEQQRVAVARALVVDPVVLLADEPTSNLDPDSARAVIDLLERRMEAGLTLVIAAHEWSLLPDPRQHIVLEAGRVVPQ